jgi:hypothetical protein
MARGWSKLGEYADEKGIPSLAGTAEFASQMNRRIAKLDIVRGAVANVVGDIKQINRSVDLISQEGFVEGGKQAFVENVDHQTDKIPVVGSLKVAFDKTQNPAERVGAVLTAGGEGILVFVAYKAGAPETTKNTPATTPVGELRAAGLKDAHHVVQDAAVRDLPGYNTKLAPGVQLPGPSTAVGSQHYVATQVQRQAGGGTLAAEMRIGYKSLRRAGFSETQARQIIAETDAYFESIDATPSTPTRIPGNRK